uniref:enoyl-CoA hydratase n=2 Tax=Parascaris univalens TaxID=6257 RepID=A0A915AVG1_PARUN
MDEATPITMTLRCGVAILKIDGPGKENVLSNSMTTAVGSMMESLEKRDDVNAVLIISAKANSFIAGADVGMLEKAKSAQEARDMSRNGQQKFQAIEESRIPIVAAIMGTCMGGGLELALACHYRIGMATDRSVFSFPEVRLGILPGAGGTQRFPRIVPLPVALDMMLSGRTINSKKAKEIGVLDILLDPVLHENGTLDDSQTLRYLEESGVQCALRLATGTLRANRRASLWKSARDYVISYPIVWNRFVRNPTLAQIRSRGGNHYPAPFAILKCVEAGIFQGSSVGYATESEEFGRLTQTRECRALIGLFHASTMCKKQRFGRASQIKCVAIMGASEVGAGLVNISAISKLNVIFVEAGDQVDDGPRERIRKYFNNAVVKGKISKEAAGAALDRIAFTSSLNEIKNADVVIVAPDTTSYEIYKEMIAKVEATISDKTPIAINVFGASLEQICVGSTHPERIIGVLYMAPVERVECVELIAHGTTHESTIATVAALVAIQRKLMLLSKDSEHEPGHYIVQCMLAAIDELDKQICERHLNNAFEVDEFSKRAGFTVGLAEVADFTGLDVILEASRRWTSTNGNCQFRLSFLQKLVDSNRMGRKCGRGFHVYSKDEKLVSSDNQYSELMCEANIQTWVFNKSISRDYLSNRHSRSPEIFCCVI